MIFYAILFSSLSAKQLIGQKKKRIKKIINRKKIIISHAPYHYHLYQLQIFIHYLLAEINGFPLLVNKSWSCVCAFSRLPKKIFFPTELLEFLSLYFAFKACTSKNKKEIFVRKYFCLKKSFRNKNAVHSAKDIVRNCNLSRWNIFIYLFRWILSLPFISKRSSVICRKVYDVILFLSIFRFLSTLTHSFWGDW